MTPIRFVATVAAVVFTVCSAPVAGARAAQNSRLQGTWVLDRGASDDVNKAIENAVVMGTGEPIPPGALERLKLMNRLSPQYVISFDAQSVHIQEGDRAAVTLPADGSRVYLTLWLAQNSPCYPGNVTAPCAEISAAVRPDALSLMVATEDTRTMKAFLVDGDRLTLVVSVSMQVPRLSPIAYRLVFTRAN